jgi:hypothetical protein
MPDTADRTGYYARQMEPRHRRYGLRRLVLCTACAAAPQGQDSKREVPESAARAIRRGAA